MLDGHTFPMPPLLQVLLEAHNTHHYLQLFKAVRASVAAGGFATYRTWFLARRQLWLVGQQEHS